MNKIKKTLFFLFSILLFTALSSKGVMANPTPIRLGGQDRYSTAVQISQDAWQNSNYVVIVSGQGFADALCAAPLAKQYDAPILSTPMEGLKDETLKEIQRLGAKNAFIIGGTGVISENVDKQLQSLNIEFQRVFGKDRHATSLEVAKLLDIDNGAIVASGYGFADALSIAPIASKKGMPILLTNNDTLPLDIKNLLNSTSAIKYVIGGTGVISENVTKSINNYERVGGKDRYDTNLKIIEKFINDIDFQQVYITTGQAYADALCGSAAAAKSSASVVLTGPQYCAARDVLRSKLDNMNNIKILGGPTIVTNQLVNNILYGTKTLKKVLGYGACFTAENTSSYNSLVNNVKTIDDVATAFFYVDGKGNVTGTFPQKHVSYGNNNGVETLLSISNEFNQKIATELLRSNTNVENFINNVLQTLTKYGYKGVNIDIENVAASDRNYFTDFMKKLYTTLKPKGFKVNVAVPAQTASTADKSWVYGYDYGKIAQNVDEVVIMTYDEHYSTGGAGPIASIGWVEDVIKYASSVIPKNKILLGIAGYGYDWPPTGAAKAYGTAEAYNVAKKYNAKVNWDQTSKTSYFNYKDENGLAHTVWFENAQSISYKLDLVNKYNLSGVGLWRLGLEEQKYWDIINSKFAYPY